MGHDTVLTLFFEEPNRVFGIREISRLSRIPKTTVQRMLINLSKNKLVRKKEEGYIANEELNKFRTSKKISAIENIYESELIKYLEDTFTPNVIILFGSFAKGEYTKESDIDLFIQSKEKSYDIEKYEKKLKHDINIIFEEDIAKLSNELLNNIINGIKMSGYLKIK